MGINHQQQSDWRLFADKIQNRTIWVQHSKQCLSFHEEIGYRKMTFNNDYELVDYIVHLLDQGYLFQ